MPRSARILLPGHVYHLTHRCHNGSFFFRFGKDRDEYRLRLWKTARRFGIVVLNCCITSNHMHLLIKVGRSLRVSVFMRHLEGEFASHYNRRKGRRGAFWNDRYHSTLVEDGRHFWCCMRYIDLNMVRAGVVKHPREWRWCGYQEIAGLRQRYRILDVNELVAMGGWGSRENFAAWYDLDLEQALKAAELPREPVWTESIAVGSEAFVRKIASMLKQRRKLEVGEWGEASWYVRDAEEAYRTKHRWTPGKRLNSIKGPKYRP